MKCVCGFEEYTFLQVNIEGNWLKVDDDDEDIAEYKKPQFYIHPKKTMNNPNPSIKNVEIFACPKCGTLKINV